VITKLKSNHTFDSILDDVTGHKLKIAATSNTYSSGYGGSGKSTDIHSNAANVTAAMCGPYTMISSILKVHTLKLIQVHRIIATTPTVV